MSVLLTPEGSEALVAAMAEADPGSLAAGERLRSKFPPELAAAAIQQTLLRRKAVTKFGESALDMFFTEDGLQQATRSSVAAWRAARFKELGVTHVFDLGCGIGADALAFEAAGLTVTAVERDPLTASYAARNIAGEVITGDAEEFWDSIAHLPETASAAVFIDPARRTSKGRTWRVSDFSPSWDFVLSLLARDSITCVKLGPGLPKELIPDGVEALWAGEQTSVVEVGLWSGPGIEPGMSALLLPGGQELRRDPTRNRLPVSDPGRFLIEPHGAVIRAGAFAELGEGLWLLDSQIAYLSFEEALDSPFATSFEILETLPYSVKTIRNWVKTNQVGTLEIKVRGIEVDPAQLRRELKPNGPNSATLILARTKRGAQVFVARRVL